MLAELKKFLNSTPLLRPVFLVLRQINRWVFRLYLDLEGDVLARQCEPHWVALKFFLREVLPVLIRTQRRPVVFFRHMALGDIICTFPAAKELKKRHPKSAFIFFCRQDFACLPRLGGITNRVAWPLHMDVMELNYSWFFSAVYKFTYSDEFENSASTESVIEEYCRQHGVTITDAHPSLEIEQAGLSKVRGLLEKNGFNLEMPTILFHTGPSGAVREWVNESWIGLVQELVGHGFTQIIQIGSTKRGDLIVVPGISIPGTLSLVDKLTLEESIALISLGSILVGIDSGLLHIAASVGTPTVGIFGSTSPQFRFSSTHIGSYVVSEVDCQGCHHRVPRLHWVSNCPFEIKCMKSIGVNRVLQACLGKLTSAMERPNPTFACQHQQN